MSGHFKSILSFPIRSTGLRTGTQESNLAYFNILNSGSPIPTWPE
jgi:hypothetical protein